MNRPHTHASAKGTPADEAGALLSSLQLCAPNFESILHLSFSGQGDMEPQWREWSVGMAAMLPSLREVHRHAKAGHVLEIVEADRKLSAAEDETIRKLCHEGRRLLLSYHPPKGERTLEKYQRLAEAGKAPTHFITVYVVRGAIFHVPFPVILKSYVFLEAITAARSHGALQPLELVEEYLRIAQSHGLQTSSLHAA
jgi:hypothetical protein